MDLPSATIATKAATTDIGIDNPIITVALQERRNSSKIITAREPPIQIFCLTNSIAESIYMVSSYTCSIFKPRLGNISSLSSLMASLIPAIISIALAPDCRTALIAMDESPKNLIFDVGSLCVKRTSPISATVTLPNLLFS